MGLVKFLIKFLHEQANDEDVLLLMIVLDQKMESAWVVDGPLTGDPELKTRSLPAWVRNKGLRSDLINATAQYKVSF